MADPACLVGVDSVGDSSGALYRVDFDRDEVCAGRWGGGRWEAALVGLSVAGSDCFWVFRGVCVAGGDLAAGSVFCRCFWLFSVIFGYFWMVLIDF